jgi:hypothetical protein
MRFRTDLIFGIIVVFFAGVPAVYPQAGTSGSIRATATVSSPIGLLAPNSVPSIATYVSDRSAGWLLLSPRRGVVVVCDGEPVTGKIWTQTPSDKRVERVFDRISLPNALGAGSIVMIIYTEN